MSTSDNVHHESPRLTLSTTDIACDGNCPQRTFSFKSLEESAVDCPPICGEYTRFRSGSTCILSDRRTLRRSPTQTFFVHLRHCPQQTVGQTYADTGGSDRISMSPWRTIKFVADKVRRKLCLVISSYKLRF